MSTDQPLQKIGIVWHGIAASMLACVIVMSWPQILRAQDEQHKEVWCQGYADRAITQQMRNLGSGCGLSGPEWSDDIAAHLGWCRLVSDYRRQGVRKESWRDKALQACTATYQRPKEPRRESAACAPGTAGRPPNCVPNDINSGKLVIPRGVEHDSIILLPAPTKCPPGTMKNTRGKCVLLVQ